MQLAAGHHSTVLAAMADGIGDLSFASAEWVACAAEVLGGLTARHAASLEDLGTFTLCEVAHNAPVHLHAGSTFAWNARFDGATVRVAQGELAAEACDFKVEGDHSIMSNLGRLQYHGRNPAIVADAQARLTKLSRWEIHGTVPSHPVLGVVLRSLHDAMAPRTLPRFVFMTPEWVASARHVLSERAASAKYADGIKDVAYTFSEEFTETPRYAFPDGTHGGFWVRCDHGAVTVGAGPLPKELGPADALTKGPYGRVIPVGRTVDAAMTDDERKQRDAYSKIAFRPPEGGQPPVQQSSPSGKGRMPQALMRVFAVLHDELSKRTSGELPVDYEPDLRDEWAQPQPFDRHADYDPTWVRYNAVDIYGNPR